MNKEHEENADIATCPKGHGWLNLDGSCEVCEPFDRERIAKLKKDFDYAIRWRRGHSSGRLRESSPTAAARRACMIAASMRG